VGIQVGTTLFPVITSAENLTQKLFHLIQFPLLLRPQRIWIEVHDIVSDVTDGKPS
jgi:hypothetical protein